MYRFNSLHIKIFFVHNMFILFFSKQCIYIAQQLRFTIRNFTNIAITLSTAETSIFRLLRNLCNTEDAHGMLDKDCAGFKVYPSTYFYPIPWEKWQMYFDENDNDEVLRSAESSYAIHVWNKHSANEQIPLTSNASYIIFAKKFCPKVYGATKQYF